MDLTKLQSLPKVVFTNEDAYFITFLRAFTEKKQFENGPISLRCKRSSVAKIGGSKLKKI